MTRKMRPPVLYKPLFLSSNASLVFACIRVDSSESIESFHLLSLLTYDGLIEPTSHQTNLASSQKLRSSRRASLRSHMRP
jgi:hypothetical protein